MKVISWLITRFAANKIGILLNRIFSAVGKTVIDDLLDVENQKKAYEFVKELHNRTDLTNNEKAAMFNIQFCRWAKSSGKAIAESVVNCLRELAVNALKSEK